VIKLPIKVKPYKHQIAAFEFAQEKLIDNSGIALLMDMGLGKSLTSIAIIGYKFLNNKIEKALIICPTSIINVWLEEFQKFADYPYSIESITGTMEKRKKKLEALSYKKGLKVALINYEATWRMETELIKLNADIIICDESQRIKTHNAAQSKMVHKLGSRAKYRIILTGTPVQNSPMDVFSQWKFLDPSLFGLSYYAFRNRYAVMGGYYNHQIIKYKNMDELTAKAHSIAYRITKEEALDLPEQIFLNRYVELEDSARKLYDNIAEQSYAELSSGEVTATNILTKLIRLSQVTGGHLKDDANKYQVVSKAKINELKNIIEDVVIDNKRKLVIFARFIPEIEAIKSLSKEMKIDYSCITGDIKIEERGEMVNQFQTNNNIKLFIAQIQTAGLGITLTAADTAVFYSLDYNYANYSQAVARIHRIGQKNTCTYINLIADGTVDNKIIKALDQKKDIAKIIVDNWKEFFKKEEK
jgi:SNF2 family DNA or RNA helicase